MKVFGPGSGASASWRQARIGSLITGALHLKASRTVRLAEPLLRARDPQIPLISEEPVYQPRDTTALASWTEEYRRHQQCECGHQMWNDVTI